MKKLLAGVLLLPILVLAQEPIILDKKVVCSKTRIIIDTLSKEFKESPIWIGSGEDNIRYSLFIGPGGDWTLIQFNKDIACVIGVGKDSKEIPIKPNV